MVWSLLHAPTGRKLRVHRVDLAGHSRSVLASLGFFPGQGVRRLANLPLGGPVLVQVGAAVIALERPLAQAVLVVVVR